MGIYLISPDKPANTGRSDELIREESDISSSACPRLCKYVLERREEIDGNGGRESEWGEGESGEGG